MSSVSVCHVVNAVGDTSMPADLATALADLDGVGDVDVLAWVEADEFRHSDRVGTHCLEIDPGALAIDRSTFVSLRRRFADYDVVHTHHNHSGFYAKLAAWRAGTPLVVTEHNNHGGFTRKGRVANGVTNRLADRIVTVSESVRDSFTRWERALLSSGDVTVIHNGVDLERIDAALDLDWSVHDVADVDPDALLVGTAGMLSEQKAHDVLIDAVDRANRRGDRPVELVIAGEGDRREELERQVERLEYGDRIHLLGFLERREYVYRMLDEVDVYAMPSRWEGFCVAALEAMAVGNACYLSDIEEFIRPLGEFARFHPVDDPDALADLLVESTSDERADLAARARAHVREEYGMDAVAEQYLDVYRAVL